VTDIAVDPHTMKLGLLLEAAQSHQDLADESLKRLQTHTKGLDAVVRDEVRRTVIAELSELVEHCDKATQGLKELRRAVQVRTVWCGAVLGASPTLAIALLVWWWLPAPERIAALRAQQQQLSDNLAQLGRNGARIDLRDCGSPPRLCVRVDRHAQAFGTQSDYLIVQGY
jgi:hypothetical protein